MIHIGVAQNKTERAFDSVILQIGQRIRRTVSHSIITRKCRLWSNVLKQCPKDGGSIQHFFLGVASTYINHGHATAEMFNNVAITFADV